MSDLAVVTAAVPFSAVAVVYVWRVILGAHKRPWTARDVAVTAVAGCAWWCLAAVGRESWMLVAVGAAHLIVAAGVVVGRAIAHAGGDES